MKKKDNSLYLNKENPEERWDKYYENYKKTRLNSFIESVNKNIFTPMFLRELYSISGNKKNRKILQLKRWRIRFYL